MRAWTRLAITGAITGAVVSGGACSEEEEPIPPALADVVMEGEATYGALAEMVAEPAVVHALAPVITHPPNLSLLKESQIVTFEWTFGATARREGPRGVETAAAELSLLPAAGARRAAAVQVRGWLGELLGPERSAVAAPEPMSGRGYYLVFTTITGTQLLRVFTTETRYTPDEKAWKALAAAGMWSGVAVTSAAFFQDRMIAGTGPFESAHVEFCIERE